MFHFWMQVMEDLFWLFMGFITFLFGLEFASWPPVLVSSVSCLFKKIVYILTFIYSKD